VTIFLFMATAAIHHRRARGGYVIFVFHQSMTILAGSLFSVDGGIKFIDGDLKRTFATADLVAVDAILG
jgi:hypothetical protein